MMQVRKRGRAGKQCRSLVGGRVLTALLSIAMVVTMMPWGAGGVGNVHGAESGYAAPATAEQLEKAAKEFSATPSGGILKIVDGKLYVWGSNGAYGLGIAKVTDSEGKVSAATMNSKLLSPVEHDYSFGSDVVQISGVGDGSFAYTSDGVAYSWGSKSDSFTFSTPSTNGGATPRPMDMSALAGKKIKSFSANGCAISVLQDQDGLWYVAGARHSPNYASASMIDSSDGMPNRESFRPVSQEYLDAIGSPVKKLIPHSMGAGVFIVTENNDLFVTGNQAQYMFLEVGGLSTSQAVNVMTYPGNEELKAAIQGVDFAEALNTNGLKSTIIDKTGSVWAVGNNANHSISDTNAGMVSKAVKVFDSSKLQKRVVKTFISDSLVCYLCSDNTLYATGSNASQFISTAVDEKTDISTPTQVMKSVSETDTIVGVYPTNLGVTVLTKSGDLYYSGSNSNGTAGTGTTEDPDSTAPVIPPDLPPVEPVTENKISFELELADGRLCAMDPEQSGMVKVTSGSSVTTMKASDFEIRAGEPFRLNVYFTDFAKMSSFVVPIRFNPHVLRVVNQSGEAYDTKKIVAAGVGNGSGVLQHFDSQVWSGTLASGNTAGGYPKVANGGGWISVSGYTLNGENASITGSNKMFSIDFMAVGDGGNGTSFSYADDTNTNLYTKLSEYTGPLFDATAGNGIDSYGSMWFIASSSMDGSFPFRGNLLPSFNTKVVDLKDFSLAMIQNSTDGKGTPVATRHGIVADLGDGFAVERTNKDATYTVNAALNPEDASFPEMKWSYEVLAPEGASGSSYTDYLSVLKTGTTSLNLKVADGFPEELTFAAIRVSAVPKTAMPTQGSNQTRSAVIFIQSFDPPETVTIADLSGSAIDEMVYHYDSVNVTKAALENKTFRADLTFKDEPSKVNYGVVWKLLDKNGHELDLSSKDAPFAIDEVVAQDGPVSSGSIRIRPLKTTFADDYVILRAESVYDSSKADEAILKVQFYPSSLTFQRELARIPVKTSKDLNDLLNIEPKDVYDTDLKWERITDSDLEGAPYLTLQDSGYVTTRDQATTTGAYEVIRVTDQLSGESAVLKISVLNLDSPIEMNNISANNQLGEENDAVTIQKDLLPGDILKLYPSYESTEAAVTIGPLSEDMLSGGSITLDLGFWLPDGFLAQEGGEFGLSVTRQVGDVEAPKEHDMMPISYSSEPSKVYGYISLSGKSVPSDRLEGVTVKISNAKHSETVTTDKNGYFKFTQYIAPGNYTLTISQDRYLKRIIETNSATGYQGLTIPEKEEFAISTQSSPIYLYPGDLNGDNAINSKDVTSYVQSWLGQTSATMAVEDLRPYDFYDTAQEVINILDLNMLILRTGWAGSSYSEWVVPAQ